jgi:predicted dehydrogenase
MGGLRIGLVGYGDWTRRAYLPALKRDGRAVIVSIAAPSRATRQRIEAELDSGVNVFGQVDALLSGPEVDAILLAVSEAAHESCLSAVLHSGIPVFYEPPVADVPDRIPPMLEALLAAPQLTWADLELGFLPVVTQASERVGQGAIGRVQRVSVDLQSSWGPVPDSGLSNINHLATWYVDLINRILMNRPKRVLVLDGHGAPAHRQNQSIGHFDYDGSWGTLKANIDSVGALEVQLEINGDDGDMLIDILSGKLRMRSRGRSEWVPEHWPAREPPAGWPGMHECVAAFLDALVSGRPSQAPRDVAQLHLVGLAAEESKASGNWAEVKDLSTLAK